MNHFIPTNIFNYKKINWKNWGILFIFSVSSISLLYALHLPAALMLGSMVAATCSSVINRNVSIPKPIFYYAQSMIGCMIALSVTASIIQTLSENWLIFLGGVLSVIIVSVWLAYLLGKKGILPYETALWGSIPGGAAAMVLMAESFGADVRMVAFMQYLRVVIVTLFAAIIAHFWSARSGQGSEVVETIWFPSIHRSAFLFTLLFTLACTIIGRVLNIPSGPMLLAMIIGGVLHAFNLIPMQQPKWLLSISYVVIGWSIGLRFTRELLIHALHLLPKLLISIVSLILICGIFAAILAHVAQIDLLTAYLATSPGGADSVAIIAESGNADVSFVMAVQTTRLILVIILTPSLIRFMSKNALKKK